MIIDSFDQYQRYRTLGDIISNIEQEYAKGRDFRILEVGANAQRNLEKFVQGEIFYTDIEMMEGFEGDDHFFVADATNLEGIVDDAYDIVVAADVFEHVPSALRENFISEIYRVAKIAAIICFPQGKPYVSQVEIRVNQFYKSIVGEDYLWLGEHIENGLPDLKLLDQYLKDNQINYSVCEHGSITLWEMMYKAHFYAVVAEELIAYRKYIDQLYMREVYPWDVADENYRIFYLMFKGVGNRAFFDELMGNLFVKNDGAYKLGKEKIQSQVHDLQQIILVRNRQDNNTENALFSLCCYFDYGDGFKEEDKEYYPKVSLEANNVYRIDLKKKREVKKLRIDLIEDKLCEVHDLKIRDDAGGVLSYETNGFQDGNMIIFLTCDPQIIISEFQGSDCVLLSFTMAVANTPIEALLLNKKIEMVQHRVYLENEAERIQEAKQRTEAECKELLSDLHEKKVQLLEYADEINVLNKNRDELKKSIGALEEKNAELKEQLSIAENNYEMISNSTFWKMTKPIRVTLNMLRRKKGIVPAPMNDEVMHQDTVSYEHFLTQYEGKGSSFDVICVGRGEDVSQVWTMLNSLQTQEYEFWQAFILLVGDLPTLEKEALEQFDQRIMIFHAEKEKDLPRIFKELLAEAKGRYIIWASDGVEFRNYFMRAISWLIDTTDARLIYSDYQLQTRNGVIVDCFKPDWSPDLLYSQNYIGRCWTVRRELYDQLGGFSWQLGEGMAYSFLLDASVQVGRMAHMPMALYCQNAEKENITLKMKEVLQHFLDCRYGGIAKAKYVGGSESYEVRYDFLQDTPLISIIIPMKDHVELTKQCVDSILEKTGYQNYEIILLDNRSEKQETFDWFEQVKKSDDRIRIFSADMEFNWSKLNNYGMKCALGEVYIFLNNDTVVISEDWLERMGENALRPEIGVVGPMLLYEDGKIQHAGVVIGMGGMADHVYKDMGVDTDGQPFISPSVTRNVMAVTGACMAISRKTIEEIGEFNEDFIICGSDVEICIRADELGLRNLYLAQVWLYHLESKSRDSYIPEIDFRMSILKYAPYRECGDPYYNVNLDMQLCRPQKTDREIDWKIVENHISLYGSKM